MPIPLLVPLLAIVAAAVAVSANDAPKTQSENVAASWDQWRYWFVNPNDPNNPFVMTGYKFGELGHPASVQDWTQLCVQNNMDVLVATAGPEFKRAPDGTQYQTRYFMSRVKGTADSVPGWSVLFSAGTQLPAPNGPGSSAQPYNAAGFAQWGDFMKRFFASLAMGQTQNFAAGGNGVGPNGVPIPVPAIPSGQTPAPSGNGVPSLNDIMAALAKLAGQPPAAQPPAAQPPAGQPPAGQPPAGNGVPSLNDIMAALARLAGQPPAAQPPAAQPPAAQPPAAQPPAGNGVPSLNDIMAALAKLAGQPPAAQPPVGYAPTSEDVSTSAALSNELGGVFLMRRIADAASSPGAKAWWNAQASSAYDRQRMAANASGGTVWPVREGDLAFRVSKYYNGTLKDMAKVSGTDLKGLEVATSWTLPLKWDVESKERIAPLSTPSGASLLRKKVKAKS